MTFWEGSQIAKKIAPLNFFSQCGVWPLRRTLNPEAVVLEWVDAGVIPVGLLGVFSCGVS